eukprot:2656512-Prorocentrum_lima.AAC.1
MTSSLVGSEMCIRDRSGGVGCQGQPLQLTASTSQYLCELLMPWCSDGACLLYTSDAADDM